MQFSIGTNTAKLLFIHPVLTQYGCLRVNLPFHCKVCSASDRRKFDMNLLRGGGGGGGGSDARTPKTYLGIHTIKFGRSNKSGD